MKMFIIVILSLIVVFAAGTYLVIPAQITIKKEMLINANPQGIYRSLADEKNWKNWMSDHPLDPSSLRDASSLFYKESGYRINNRVMNSIEIFISAGNSTLNSFLNVLPVSQDSTALEWRSSIPAGYNPFNRIGKYLLAKKINNDIDEILSGMKAFLSENKNIYHLEIRHRLVMDTVMMSTREKFKKYPSTDDIYKMIEKVKNHIRKFHGRETNFPMLNINVHNDSSYDAMVAIPVDHSLPEQGNIFLKRMLYHGNILEAEVKGGAPRISQGFSDLKNYIMDNGKTPAAIPFEMLITNRSKEPDTSKWVTKLFYPIY